MKTLELSLAQIGNSRGVRLPADLIRKHGFERGVVLEDRGHEIVLKPKGGPRKLSWDDTAREMALADEDWTAWEIAGADGLDQVPWVAAAANGVGASNRKAASRKV